MSSEACILKGCDFKYINSLVSRSIRGWNEEILNNDISNKALNIVSTYDIDQCMKIIMKHGDFHDAYVTLQSIEGYRPDLSDKLEFHRQVAFIYVKKIIKCKMDVKVAAYNCKSKIARGAECSICLEMILSDGKITRCNHTFHRACIAQWGRSTCPNCRGNL